MARDDDRGASGYPRASPDILEQRRSPPIQHNPNYMHPSQAYTEPRSPRESVTATHDFAQFDPNNRLSQARQPIDAAVASAVGNTGGDTAISPELVAQLSAQITAQVLQQLQSKQMPSPPHDQTAFPPETGSQSQTSATRHDVAGEGFPEPYRAAEDPTITQTSPRHSHAQTTATPSQRPMSPYNQVADNDTNADEHLTRPRGPRRISTGGDPTIIEKIWGDLFTESGEATPKLGQFLRGIAVHVIEDYEPKHSLVMTPEKIQKWYDDTKLSTEAYPWHVIFDDQTSSISRLFRTFEIQHHLVQDRPDERPGIPGLTPKGFEMWVIGILRAHPDEEFQRLANTAMHMPISNPDNPKERFPKELSRRLFPADPDLEIRARLQDAFKKHCGIPIRQQSVTEAETFAPPPTTSYREDEPTPKPINVSSASQRQDALLSPTSSYAYPSFDTAHADRGRKAYSTAPSEAAASEDDGDITPQPPIERERKPYVAEPGGGKKHEDLDRSTYDYVPTPEMRPVRTNSMSQGGPPPELRKSGTMPISIHQPQQQPTILEPPSSGSSRHIRSGSSYARDPMTRGGRGRSPSLNGDTYGHRSESNMAYGTSPYQQQPQQPSADVTDDTRRRHRDYERIRESHPHDRYDAARMTAYDVQDRLPSDTGLPIPGVPHAGGGILGGAGGSGRPRIQSSVGILAGTDDYSRPRSYFDPTTAGASGGADDYYRTTGAPLHHTTSRTSQDQAAAAAYQYPPPPPQMQPGSYPYRA